MPAYTTDPTESNSDFAATHDIIVKRGDTFWRGFEFWLDEAETTPEDITDTIFRMEVRTKYNGAVIFTFTEGDGLTKTSANTIDLDLLPLVMQAGAGTFIYDIEKTLTDGTVVTFIQGEFTINPDVTQAQQSS